ncbi:GrpB-like predicted nucleotidyltransferase (UPF0157 family) [Pseudomonas nitritireducens]|uniref:GrpB-like predicted nucleotidyltransferase (UPF0157 family) n=1 Tax=Pseudomonas nitroreducens TaxID=46680 RepID=A0A7W7P1P1_PSENT|nr:GrpB family protein [Pseudomonas nitritireducens]MBB4865028.1 GrpB-like predicted nucleotidyltransferase (UPF0157 family) [Pseudomonas nitritireducens]
MPPQAPEFDGQRWSNAEADRIEVVTADPSWPQRFAEEARVIADELNLPGLGIEHIGSTAVPGLDAKPIIDILLLPPPQSDPHRLIEPLQRLGYQYWSENPDTTRMFFVKGMPPLGSGRTHHVHVMDLGEASRRLLFRDWVRNHPEDAQRYAQVKHELARRYPTDRDAYTAGKDDVVAQILGRALNPPEHHRDREGDEPHGGEIHGQDRSG